MGYSQVILLALLLNIFSFAQDNQQAGKRETFTNPVWDGADPWIIKEKGMYYGCFSSGNGISIYRSSVLSERGEIKKIWSAPSEGWNRKNIWAPELHFIDGHWYIYYAAGEAGPPYIHQRTGVLMSENDDPFSKYTDMGMLYTGDNPDMKSDSKWAIDMTVFRYRNVLYAVWSGWKENAATDKTSQHLYMAEMENPCKIKSPRVRISSPEQSWETGGPLDLQEGPEVLRRHGELFIVYSCRESWTTDYRLGILKLKQGNTNPLSETAWEKTGPVFSGPFGTGHCSFTKSEDGKEDWIIYHAKKDTKEGWSRDVRMQPFVWKKDGYPDFGMPVPVHTEIARPSGEAKILKKELISAQ